MSLCCGTPTGERFDIAELSQSSNGDLLIPATLSELDRLLQQNGALVIVSSYGVNQGAT
jgi:hypothetical protein